MKKAYMAVAVALALSTMISGCSKAEVPSVKEMMVGKDKLDFDPSQCITLKDYKGIEVDCTVTDKEVQSEIDNLLDNNKIKIKKGTCKKGDTVNIDYSGKKDGKKFDNGTAEDQTIVLGESHMIDGFDDAIIGMKVGEKKDAKMTFPKDYSEKSLAGKDVVFTIKLNYISKDATFDDAFVAKNSDYKTVSEYKEGTKKKLAQNKKDSAGYTAFETLTKDAKVTNTPKSLEDKWRKIISNDLEMRAKQSGMEVDSMLSMYGMDKESYLKESVANQIKQILAVEYIVQKEGIEITDQEIKDEIKVALSQAGQSESDYRKSFDEYYQGAQTLEEFIEFNLKAKKILEVLKNNAKIKQ